MIPAQVTPAQLDLARRLVHLPGFRWDDGMLTHTTRAAGLPGCPAGTPIRVQDGIGDLVVEGYFGAIMPDASHRHPDYAAIMERHEASLAAAEANALPDLTDDATGGVLLARLWALDPAQHVHRDGPRVIVHVAPGIAEYVGETLGEACARALVEMGRADAGEEE